MAHWDLTRAMNRYNAKVNGTTLAVQLAAAKDQMVANYTADSNDQYLVEGAIQTAMGTTGTLASSLLTSAYMAFGKSMLRLGRRYAVNGTVRSAQATIMINKAYARGLDNAILAAISEAVFALIITP